MSDDYDITCAKCFVTFTGHNRDQVMVAFRGHEKEAHGYMMGQEWYDRFVREVLALPEDFGFVDMQNAAKRAAGLE